MEIAFLFFCFLVPIFFCSLYTHPSSLDFTCVFFNTKRMSDAFSLDLQDKYTRIGDVKTSGDKLDITALGQGETAPNFYISDNKDVMDKQADVIAKLYGGLKIKKKSVNVVIPDGVSYSQVIEMPMLKEKELLSAIRYQSDEFIPMPIEETNLDIEILHEDPQNKKLLVLIVAAPKKLVSQVEKTIELAGLSTGILENELTAVGRLYSEKLQKQSNGVSTLIFNFGYTSSSLYLIDAKTSVIIYSRTVKIGYELLLRSVRVNLNVDDKKGAELLKSIGFAQGGSYNLDAILAPIGNELAMEIQKFIATTRERLNAQIGSIHLLNMNSSIAMFDKKINQLVSLPSAAVPLNQILVSNPLTQSYGQDISSFVSVIAASL